ncbi:MAG: hypothetical protein ABII97_01645 [Patescibacteria group bacterium]
MNYAFIIFGLSLFGLLFIIGIRFYGARDLDKGSLRNGVLSDKSFFYELEVMVGPLSKSIAGYIVRFFIDCRDSGFFSSLNSLVSFFKKRSDGFRDYMYGRKVIAKNGCKGYWNRINNKEE